MIDNVVLRSMGSLASFRGISPLIVQVTGYAVYPIKFELENGRIVPRFQWQIGINAPSSGEENMVLLPLSFGDAESFEPIALIPANVVKRADIRVGDVVTATCTGKGSVRVSETKTIEVPVVSGFWAGISTIPFARNRLPSGLKEMQLLIDDLPPRVRPHWRWSQPQEDAYYPQEPWHLGDDFTDESCQMLELGAGHIGRGGRILWIGDSGSGKTTTLLHLCRTMARHNKGRPIKLVVGLIGERPEDVGKFSRGIKDSIGDEETGFIPGVVGVHKFLCSADYQSAPLLLMQIGQLALAFAQRQAEKCILLPEEERYSLVVIFDSLSRIFHAMKFSGIGRGMTETGGENPYAAVLAGVLQLTARTGFWTNPYTGESVWVDATTLFTLLTEDTYVSKARQQSQEGIVNAFICLQGQKTRDPRARIWPTLDLESTLIREWELLYSGEPWAVEARKRLREKLFRQYRGKLRRLDEATMILEQLLRNHGTARVVLKSLVPDLLMEQETQNARELCRAGEIPRELSGLEVLAQTLVIPREWGEEIWARLAEEGLLPSREELVEQVFEQEIAEHLQKLQGLIAQGFVFHSLKEVVAKLGIEDEKARIVLEHLEVNDWVLITEARRPEIEEYFEKSGLGLAEAIKDVLGIPSFSVAKRVVAALRRKQGAEPDSKRSGP